MNEDIVKIRIMNEKQNIITIPKKMKLRAGTLVKIVPIIPKEMNEDERERERKILEG